MKKFIKGIITFFLLLILPLVSSCDQLDDIIGNLGGTPGGAISSSIPGISFVPNFSSSSSSSVSNVTSSTTESADFLNNIVFESKEVVYDGTNKYLYIQGEVPYPYYFDYFNNDKVDAGTYIVLANFYSHEDSTFFVQKTATLTIKQAKITGVSLEPGLFNYDGQYHEILVEGDLPEGVKISYENNRQINKGTYDVVAHLYDDAGNYEPLDLFTTMVIAETTITPIAKINEIAYNLNGEYSDSYVIEGTLIARDSSGRGYIQDENGDIIYVYNTAFKNCDLGCSATILGKANLYNGMVQFGNGGVNILSMTSSGPQKIDHGNPLSVGAEEFAISTFNKEQTYYGKYIELTGARIYENNGSIYIQSDSNKIQIQYFTKDYPELDEIFNLDNLDKEVIVRGYSIGYSGAYSRIAVVDANLVVDLASIETIELNFDSVFGHLYKDTTPTMSYAAHNGIHKVNGIEFETTSVMKNSNYHENTVLQLKRNEGLIVSRQSLTVYSIEIKIIDGYKNTDLVGGFNISVGGVKMPGKNLYENYNANTKKWEIILEYCSDETLNGEVSIQNVERFAKYVEYIKINTKVNYSTWSVIGTMNGDDYTKDLNMRKVNDNIYLSEPIYIAMNDEFKVRKDGNWDLYYGDCGMPYSTGCKVQAPMYYYIELYLPGDGSAGIYYHPIHDMTFDDQTFEYDGFVKSIYVANVPMGVEVVYTNNEKTDVGEYLVTATFYDIHGNRIECFREMEATIIITQPE